MQVAQVKKLIVEQITKPTARDQQKNIGPSEIGGCPLCIGERLAQHLPEQYPDLYDDDRFGLRAWQGTAVHEKLDRDVEIPGAIKEQKLFVHELEGYGTIKGSADFFLAGHVVDYKNPGKFSCDAMSMAWREEPNRIPKTIYRVQQHLYGYAYELDGAKVETVNLCVIPCTSNDPDDIVFYTEKYNREVAVKALDRLELIWKYVKDGKLEELPMDADCYICTRVLWRA